MSGTVMAWGENGCGQLGNGTQPPESRSMNEEYEHEFSPLPAPVSGLAGVATIVGQAGMPPYGGASIYALKEDGTVWAWGLNHVGQLGDGTTSTTRAKPVRVSGLTDVKAILSENLSAYALKEDGTVWAWGRNQDPSDNDRTLIPDRTSPAPVFGFTDIESMVTGSWMGIVSLYGLRSDGTVWAWGDNHSGQLGDGSTSTRLSPVQVLGLNGVVSIAAGERAAYAVASDGTLWAWGDNSSGQLGDGTQTDRLTPVRVIGLPAIAHVHPADEGAYAIATDGSLWAWGSNRPYFWGTVEGALGVGDSEAFVLAPARVNVPVAVAGISTGLRSSYALGTDGSVWAWGANNVGQLGLGRDSSQPVPAGVPGLSEIVAISTDRSSGSSCTLALRADGSLWAWGSGWRGQMGDGATDSAATPQPVPGVDGAKDVFVVGATIFAALGASGGTDLSRVGNAADPVDANAIVERETGKTALMHWSAGGLSVEVAALLSRGADPNKVDADGDSALYYAASNGHAEVVRMLLTHGGEWASVGLSGPALLAAASGGHSEVVVELLEQGDDVNQVFQGRTPLMAAASQGDDELVRTLVQYGAKLEAEDLDGDTALYYAASKRRVSTVELLLRLGSSPDPRSGASGQTPLTIAASLFQTEIVLALLRAGADPASMYRQGFELAYNPYSMQDRRAYSPAGIVRVPLWAVRENLSRTDLTVIGLSSR